MRNTTNGRPLAATTQLTRCRIWYKPSVGIEDIPTVGTYAGIAERTLIPHERWNRDRNRQVPEGSVLHEIGLTKSETLERRGVWRVHRVHGMAGEVRRVALGTTA